MKNYFNTLLLVIILGLTPLFSNAQKTSSIPDWERKIHKVLANDKSHAVIKDSIALYCFNVKLEIVKNKTGKPEIGRMVASDNLFYKIFPNYNELKTIDYRTLLGVKRQATLVIPVIIYNTSKTASSKYNRQGEVALISLETAANTTARAFSFIDNASGSGSQNYVFANPRVIHVINKNDKEPITSKN
ncbi:hypothetical protein ACFE6N_17355 [Pedobacter sp. BG31]|uniref:hypothetical protein n=1 Tax=Pedobacter sp. BG31 TaxID=3349697 RepID=UPI0035F3A9FD